MRRDSTLVRKGIRSFEVWFGSDINYYIRKFTRIQLFYPNIRTFPLHYDWPKKLMISVRNVESFPFSSPMYVIFHAQNA